MKKVIFSCLIALLYTPCLAQSEIKELFTIKNTLWTTRIKELPIHSQYRIGFSESEVYIYDSEIIFSFMKCPSSHFKDYGIISFFTAQNIEGELFSGFAIPLFGRGFIEIYPYPPDKYIPPVTYSIIIKNSDVWTPPTYP